MKKRIVLCILALSVLCAAACHAEETGDGPAEIRCDEWHFSVKIPSGTAAVPYDYEDPEYEMVTGGGLAIFTGEDGSLPQAWILRRDHSFNNPDYYLGDARYSYLYEHDAFDYEGIEAGLYHFGGITLKGADCRFLDEAEEELFRELRLIPYRDDRGTEFVLRYAAEEADEAFHLLDTVIRNYQTDEEEETAQAMHRPIQKEPDLLNGTFSIRAEDVDRIETEGYFTAVLYTKDRYAAEDVQSMKAGDTVLINGRVHTLTDISPWENDDGSWYEANISTEEWAREQSLYGFCFEEDGDGFVLYIMDDWYSLSRAASVRIDVASAHPIAYYDVPGGDDPELIAENLLAEEGGAAALAYLNPYNTTCTFRNGELVRIDSGSYPIGPIDPFIPVQPEE